MRPVVTLSLLLAALVPSIPAATVDTSAPPVAARVLDLFDRLRAAHDKVAAGGRFQLVAFQLSEAEINDYLTYALKATPRPGVSSISVKVSGNDNISTLTNVDFDALEQWHPGTIPPLLRKVLRGKKTISVDFRIHAENSNMTFSVEKARYENTPLPPVFVEKMIEMMAARQPEHYDTSRPIPIPFDVRKVWTTEHTLQGHN
jgi:hypothetical protein